MCVGLTALPPARADCHEIWEPEPPGTLGACPGLYIDCFTFTFTLSSILEVKNEISHTLNLDPMRYLMVDVTRYWNTCLN